MNTHEPTPLGAVLIVAVGLAVCVLCGIVAALTL